MFVQSALQNLKNSDVIKSVQKLKIGLMQFQNALKQGLKNIGFQSALKQIENYDVLFKPL